MARNTKEHKAHAVDNNEDDNEVNHVNNVNNVNNDVNHVNHVNNDVRVDNDNDVNHINHVNNAVRVAAKAEKKARQRAQKAELRKAAVEEDQEDVEVFTINQVTTKNNPHQQRVSSGARR